MDAATRRTVRERASRRCEYCIALRTELLANGHWP
jgi:hypothetical protein